MTSPSSTLRKAADLQERIEQLQQELDALLQQTGAAADDAARRFGRADLPIEGR
jgi:outer membrane murein-binding lipoprotein Lpp